MPKINRKINQPTTKMAGGQIDESEEFYRAIFELSPDMIVVHDGKIVKRINPAGIKMLGATHAEEIIGKPIANFVRADDLDEVKERFEQLSKGKSVPRIMRKLIRLDGSMFDIEAATSPFRYQGAPAALLFAHDTTERKQTEDALRESESKLRQAQHFARTGSWTWNILTNRLDWSDEMYVIFGVEKETFSGSLTDVIEQAIHPDDRAKVEQSNLMVMRKGRAEPLEYRILWKDGSIHVVRAEPAEIALDQTGAPTFLHGTAQEITERKQAELSLRKSESRLNQAAQLARLGIWDWDATTDRVEWGGDMFRIYGISPDKFTGKGSDYFEFTRADYRKIQQENVAKAFEHGITETDLMAGKGVKLNPKELCIVRPDGTECYTLGDAICIVDENGKPLRMLGITQDITERRKAEEALRESEENYRYLFENMNDAFALHKIILNESGKPIDYQFLSVNPVFTKRLGMKPEDIINHTARELFPKTEQSWIDTFGKVAIDGQSVLFTNYSVELDKYYETRIYCPRPGYFAALFSDITDRKQAEDALRESEENYRRLFDNAILGIFQSTPEGQVIAINQAFARMFGYDSPQDVVNSIKNVAVDLFADPNRRAEIIRLMAENPNLRTFENVYLRKDGKTFIGNLHTTPIHDANGRLIRMEGIVEDITQRREAEEQLRESEERFRSLSEATFEGIMIHDQGIIQDVNQALMELLGYDKPEDLIGKNAFDTLPPITPEALERIKAGMKAGSTEPFEIASQRPDGTTLPMEIQARNMTFKGRNLRVVAMRDVTKRKQAEHTQARLTAILEATPDFVSITALDQRIIYINRAGRRMIGIGEDEDISGLKIGDLSPAWANEIILKDGIPNAIQNGTWSGETARLTRDGREIPVTQVILAHTGPDGKLEYLSTIARDNTESKRAEEKIRRQLEHLTALGEIDRAITSSFDLKLNLKTLLGHVTRQLQVDAADVLLFDPDRQMLEYIGGNGFRSQNIENISMSIDRGYAGRAILERHIVNVPNLQEQPGNFVRAAALADDDFVSYFGVPLIAKEQVHGVLEIFHRAALQPDDEWLNFLNALAEQAAIAIDNVSLFNRLQRSNRELSQAYDLTIEGWSRAMDLRDKETEGHTLRVTEKTLQLARAMGINESELTHIRRGALLHDIGKIGVPDSILLKSDELSGEEWEIMRKHPTYAHEMISSIDYLKPALDIPYSHHEKWDGTGYPRGLKGEQIPLVARIFSVVDVWDALRSDRPYRKAWEKEKVLEHIRSLAGTHFDPAVVDVFLEVTDGT